MQGLVEKSGTTAIMAVGTATLVLFISNISDAMTWNDRRSLFIAFGALIGGLSVMCILATCICIARYTTPQQPSEEPSKSGVED